MDIKKRLLTIREHNPLYDHREDGVNYNELCLDALAEIERLEKVPARIRALRRYTVSQGVMIDDNPDVLLKWYEVELVLDGAPQK